MRVIKAISEDVLLENSGTCVVDRSYNVLKSPCYGVCTAPTMPYHWQMISLQFNSILCGRAIVRQSCHKLLGMCIQVTFLCSNAFRPGTQLSRMWLAHAFNSTSSVAVLSADNAVTTLLYMEILFVGELPMGNNTIISNSVNLYFTMNICVSPYEYFL